MQLRDQVHCCVTEASHHALGQGRLALHQLLDLLLHDRSKQRKKSTIPEQGAYYLHLLAHNVLNKARERLI